MGEWPAELPKNLPLTIITNYDLKQEIKSGRGPFSKEELIAAKELVEAYVGKELIERCEVFWLIDGLFDSEMMKFFVIFSDEDRKNDPRCIDRTFWVYKGRIIQVRV